MENELRADSNLLQRVIAAIRDESKAVAIAQVAMIISAVFSVLCVLAIAASFNANSKVDYELAATRKELLVSQNRTTLYIAYVQELRSDLIINGFEPPPLPEE